MDDFTIYRLKNSSPEYVLSFYERLNFDEYENLSQDEIDELELSIVARNHDLTNLAIARYGRSPEAIFDLFSHGNELIKKACCAGQLKNVGWLKDYWIDTYRIVPLLIEKSDWDLLRALLLNPNIADSCLEDLFEKKSPFDNIEDENWLLLIVNQRAKLSRLGVETASKSSHLSVSPSGVLGVLWPFPRKVH